MLNLTSITDLIQIINAGTVNLQVVVDYVDASSSGTVFTPGNQPTLITTAATTTICNSPGASVQRGVSHISIVNAGSTAAVVQIQRISGSTTTDMVPVVFGSPSTTTIPSGYSLEYNEQNGWVLIDKSLGRVETPLAGRLLARTVLTSGTTFTTTTSTNTIIIKGVGGGGGGGGCRRSRRRRVPQAAVRREATSRRRSRRLPTRLSRIRLVRPARTPVARRAATAGRQHSWSEA